jgi:hypothetical protein
LPADLLGAGRRGRRLTRGAHKTAADERIDQLYALPAKEFVQARNQLAAELAEQGESAAAQEVRALERPSVSAALVNQLHHRERKAFDDLLDAGRSLREAQRLLLAGKSPEKLQRATQELRAAVSRLLERARKLSPEGSGLSKGTLDRAGRTLDALARSEHASELAGRLAKDLEPSGFESLSAEELAAAASESPPRANKSAKQPKKRSEPHAGAASRAAAERNLERARAAAKKAKSENKLRAARRKAAAARLAKARQELERGEKQLARARGEHAAAQHSFEQAEREAKDAELGLELAQGEVEKTEAALDVLRRSGA